MLLPRPQAACHLHRTALKELLCLQRCPYVPMSAATDWPAVASVGLSGACKLGVRFEPFSRALVYPHPRPVLEWGNARRRVNPNTTPASRQVD